MITHVVLLRLRPGLDVNSEVAQEAHRAMLALPGKIAQIRDLQCGFNLTPDVQAWDYVLIAHFDSEPQMLEYFEHPAHLAVVAQWEPIAELAFGDLAH